MPLYEYRCEKCGEQFEVRQKFSDEPLNTHEVCGGPVHRLISAPAFQFKGSGWYVTDYAKSGKPPANGDSPKSGDSEKKDGSGKTDSKKDSSTAATTAKDSSSSSSSTSDSK